MKFAFSKNHAKKVQSSLMLLLSLSNSTLFFLFFLTNRTMIWTHFWPSELSELYLVIMKIEPRFFYFSWSNRTITDPFLAHRNFQNFTLNHPTWPLHYPTWPLNFPTWPLNYPTWPLHYPTWPLNFPTRPLNFPTRLFTLHGSKGIGPLLAWLL